jgi:amidase
MPTRRKILKGVAASLFASAAIPASVQTVNSAPKSPDQFIDYDALGMAELIKKGEISAAEAVELTIRRIEAVEPIVNAITTRTYERALENADKIDKDTTFAGFPILIKDMIDVGGVRRTDGSRMMLTNVPANNVSYIDGVEAAGLNIVGMTNVPEFAQLALITNNMAFGLSRNPWDLSKSTLGSSGGAAAAVASGMVPMAHGTDGGGSNRLPACAQGLLGMKPSRARMLSGETNGKHAPFKTNQTISRTVRDSAALFAETEDPNGPFEVVGQITGPATRRLRIGYAPSLAGGGPVEPAVVAAQEATAQLLRDLGHEVIEAAIPINTEEFNTHFSGAFLGLFAPLGDQAISLSGLGAGKSGLLDPFTASLIEYGASIPASAQAKGLEYLATVPELFARTFEDVDVLLSPVMPFVSIEVNALSPETLVNESVLAMLYAGGSFTAPVNLSGHTAMSVPLNWDDQSGMPVGSMFQAKLGNDRLLYEFAFELEAARPWKDIWAPYSVKHIPI